MSNDKFRIIEVRGYYRKVKLKAPNDGVEAKKWINPYKRKIKIKEVKVDKQQKTVEDFGL